jgi:hypothetical protein
MNKIVQDKKQDDNFTITGVVRFGTSLHTENRNLNGDENVGYIHLGKNTTHG